MKVKMLKGCVVGVGKTVEKGEKVDLPEKTAKALILSGKAEAIKAKAGNLGGLKD